MSKTAPHLGADVAKGSTGAQGGSRADGLYAPRWILAVDWGSSVVMFLAKDVVPQGSKKPRGNVAVTSSERAGRVRC